MKKLTFLIIIISLMSCTNSTRKKNISEKMETFEKGTYGYDLNFLKKFIEPVELKNGSARVLLSAEYQGRVMTSASKGENGFSYGWINHDLIASGEIVDKINPVGGEERFWLGPEGGQFSLFFEKKSDFVFENWQTPACIDTEPFELKSKSDKSAVFFKSIEIENYSGYRFNFDVNRRITILDNNSISDELAIELPVNIKMIGYKTENAILNTGDDEWKKKTGLISVWLLGMFNPSPSVTVVVPYKDDVTAAGIKDDYFGKVPSERLIKKDGIIFFRGDGKQRGKIGIPPGRALPFLGSYDEANNVLTIVKCNIPDDKTDYVNSAWEFQESPFKGDAINSYNDGPLDDGSQLGPFYELETSSHALNLKPSEEYSYKQSTFHFEGSDNDLNQICLEILGISLNQIISAFQDN